MRELGKHGLRLWNNILDEVRIDDAGGLEILLLACEGLDRAERLRAAIDEDGEAIRGANGSVRANPLLTIELGTRAYVVRTIERLGIVSMPTMANGRPPGPRF